MSIYVTYYISYLYIQSNLTKLTDHGTDFKWSIYGGGRFRELECCYNGIIWAFV